MIIIFAINRNKNQKQMLPLTFFEVIGFFLPMVYNYCVAIFVYSRFLNSSRRAEVPVSYLWRYGSACSILLDTVIYRSSALLPFALWIQTPVLAIKIARAHPARQILPFFVCLKEGIYFQVPSQGLCLQLQNSSRSQFEDTPFYQKTLFSYETSPLPLWIIKTL